MSTQFLTTTGATPFSSSARLMTPKPVLPNAPSMSIKHPRATSPTLSDFSILATLQSTAEPVDLPA